jgi:hypothetical protein
VTDTTVNRSKKTKKADRWSAGVIPYAEMGYWLPDYQPKDGKQTVALSFIVARPTEEPGFRLERQEANDRVIRYTLHPYAADKPHGQRYNGQQ